MSYEPISAKKIQSNGALNELELISLFSERISHPLRNQISVFRGVLEEFLRSSGVSQKEIREDGEIALEKMIEVVSGIGELVDAPFFKPEMCSLSEVLHDCTRETLGLEREDELEMSIHAHSPIRLFDRYLIRRALRCMMCYVVERRKRFPSAKTRLISLRLEPLGKRERIVISFFQGEAEDFSRFQTAQTLKELAFFEQSPSALQLFFADGVARIHDGSSEVEHFVPTEMEISLIL